ncbi:MAG: nuclear transport factor 2 family protein [Actinomycetes bacterium]
MSSARELVEAYFACMKAGDISVAELFCEEAQLVGLGTVISGRPAICQFYEESIRSGRPQPELFGDLMIDGNRVAAELLIRLSGQPSLHVVDLFEIDGEHIASLTYFVSDHP